MFIGSQNFLQLNLIGKQTSEQFFIHNMTTAGFQIVCGFVKQNTSNLTGGGMLTV